MSTRRTLAAAVEVPVGCVNVVDLRAADPCQLHAAATEELYVTSGAAELLAYYPHGAARRMIQALLASGELKLVEPVALPIYGAGGRRESPTEAPATPMMPPMEGPHWIEYQFTDVAEQPLEGLPYSLRLSNGAEERGTLPADGRLRRDGIPEGQCVAKIGEIESARWSTKAAGVHEEVRLVVVTTGFEPGADVQLQIFRLYKERADDLLATLSATLDENGEAEAAWQYQREDENDQGAQLIFRAQVGSVWRKSTVLRLERGIVSAGWARPEVLDGEQVALIVDVRGVPNGTSATIRLYEKDWLTDDDPVSDAQLPAATVQNNRIETTWTAAWQPDDERTGCQDFIEMYYVVEVDGLIAHSEVLTVWPVWELAPTGSDGQPSPNAAYKLCYPDGSEQSGRTDGEGRVQLAGVKPDSAAVALHEGEPAAEGEQVPPDVFPEDEPFDEDEALSDNDAADEDEGEDEEPTDQPDEPAQGG